MTIWAMAGRPGEEDEVICTVAARLSDRREIAQRICDLHNAELESGE